MRPTLWAAEVVVAGIGDHQDRRPPGSSTARIVDRQDRRPPGSSTVRIVDRQFLGRQDYR
jgi:hypothetical protein